MQWKSIHCGYVPEEEPAPPPSSKLVIEPQVDPIKAEQMFTEYVDQLLKRYLRYATWLNNSVMNRFQKNVCPDRNSQATRTSQLAAWKLTCRRQCAGSKNM